MALKIEGGEKMEKLNPNVVALSLGLTTTILYIVCLVLVAITPVPIVINVVNALQHSIDISSLATKNITLVNLVIGIIGWFVIATVTGYIFAFLYNQLGEKLG